MTTVKNGSVLTSAIELAEDTLYFDPLNDRMGIATSTPSVELDIDGDLNVSGDITLNTDLTVSGDLDVDGYTYLDDATITGDVDVSGNLSVGNNLDVTGTADIDGYTTFSSGLSVGNDSGINGKLVVGNDLTVNRDIHLHAETNESCAINIGYGRKDNGFSAVNLISDSTHSDYVLRMLRYNTGVNANSYIQHRGTGSLNIQATDAGKITLRSNSIDALTVASDGYVGVGNTSPSYKLHVETNDESSYAAKFFNDGNSTNRYGIIVQCGLNDQSASLNYHITFKDGDGGNEGHLVVNSGILEIQQASDARYKTNISDSKTDALNKINALKVREFDYKNGTKHPTGFIAQEVASVIPEAVSEDFTGKLMIAPTRFIGYLVKAVQELSAEVERLKNGV